MTPENKFQGGEVDNRYELDLLPFGKLTSNAVGDSLVGLVQAAC